MDYDPRHEYNLAKLGHALNPHQFNGDPNGDNVSSREDFNGQMRAYREANPTHRGVMDYHETGNRGFMAHTEGIMRQAGSVDNWGDPLIDHHGRFSSTYQEKHGENEAAPPRYKRDLRTALENGTADPVHLSMGHHMRGDSYYGWAVPDHVDNREMLGNGNHRAVMAYENGITRIPAKHRSRGTGEGYEETTQAGYDHSSDEIGPKRGSPQDIAKAKGESYYSDKGGYHEPAPLRQEQFSPVKPALNTEGQGMYAGMLRAYGKNTAQINQIGAGFGHAPVKGAGDMNTHELAGMRLALDARKPSK